MLSQLDEKLIKMLSQLNEKVINIKEGFKSSDNKFPILARVCVGIMIIIVCCVIKFRNCYSC